MNSPYKLFCPVCKIENLPGAITCAFCQASLIDDPPVSLTTLKVSEFPADMTANWDPVQIDFGAYQGIVICVEKSPVVLKIEISEPFILGRNLENAKGKQGEVIIDLTSFEAFEKGVSRQHAVLRPVESGYEIADLDSTNGTWVNQRRLIPGRFYPLDADNEIRVGHLLLRLLVSVSNTHTKQSSKLSGNCRDGE